MSDTRTPEQRRRIMAAVRSADTTPELQLRHALYAAGIRGWRCNFKRAPGKPDLEFYARPINADTKCADLAHLVGIGRDVSLPATERV